MKLNYYSFENNFILLKDAVYWVELFAHVPLSWITIYFLAKKDSRYHITELLLSGI